MDNIYVTRSSMPSFEEYCAEIRELWDTRWLTNMGVKHDTFQNMLESYLEIPHVTLFTNGHLALESAIEAFRFPRGSEVITTPFTFASTTHAILRSGLVPVFCDIRREDLTIDPEKIEDLITEKTVAIVPVHVYGNICDMDAIDRIAKRRGLKVICDAAHAFGVRYKGVPAAGFGDVSVFSFHATKVFHTIEGGAACYRDDDLAQVLDDLKNFGIRDEELVAAVGGNAKMSEFQAAMGICNLRRIDRDIAARKAVAERYREQLSGVEGLRLVTPQKGIKANYSYFPVLFEGHRYTRDEAARKLAEKGIFARKYFYPLTSDFACFQNRMGSMDDRDGKSGAGSISGPGSRSSLADRISAAGAGITAGSRIGPAGPVIGRQDTPMARQAAAQVLTLPLYPELTAEETDRICEMLR